MTLEELSAVELNEIKRRIVFGERFGKKVKLNARTARRLFEQLAEPRLQREVDVLIEKLEREQDERLAAQERESDLRREISSLEKQLASARQTEK